MFKSKALKGFSDEEVNKPETRLHKLWMKIYLSDFYETVTKPYNEVCYFFRRLKKHWDYYRNVLRYDWDFDSHGYLLMLNYKFKRLYACLEKGHAIQEDKDMQALRICIKLSDRLYKDEYDQRTWGKVEAKFGELGHRTEELNDGSNCSLLISNYGGDESEETAQKAFEMRSKLCEVNQKCQERDERNLYALMLRHRQSWWD